MPTNSPKLKLLYLADILWRETDEDNSLSGAELIKKLAEHGISSNRKTLYEDIALLKDEYNMDIYTAKKAGAANLYHLASRDFELPELKLLIDTIQYSQFVTASKSKGLIGKLSSLTSVYQAEQLGRSVIIPDNMKGMNEGIYYAVDGIHHGIIQKKKISFKYFDYTIDKKKEYRNDGKRYTVSPYTLACSNNSYYLIAFHEKYNDISQFRIDRMEKIEIVDEPRRELPKGFKIEKYVQKTFSMFGGELKELEIVFDNSLVNAALDRFGKQVKLTRVDDNHFLIKTSHSVSPTFFSWLFQFGDKVKLIAPQDVKDELKNHTERFIKNVLS